MAQLTPQQARQSFKMRRALSYPVPVVVLSSAVFLMGFYLISTWTDGASDKFIFSCLGVLAIVAVYMWQFAGDKEGPSTFLSITNIQIFCPHCGKSIPRQQNWICGYCDGENTDQIFHPVIYKCSHCDQEPKSYICSHCEKTVFFDIDNDARHAARLAVSKKPGISRQDPLEEKKRAHILRKTELEQEIEITALNKRLAQLKLSPEFKEEVSAREKIGKEFSEFQQEVLGFRMLERNERARYAEEFKDDPEGFEDNNLALDDFLERQGLAPNRSVPKKKGAEESAP